LPPDSALEPKVQYIVEIDVGKERRKYRPLRSANFSGMHQPLFHDSGFQHPANQAKDSLVSYPLLEELQQPLVINMIKGSHDILPTSRVSLRR
jgi:hypothetical protein